MLGLGGTATGVDGAAQNKLAPASARRRSLSASSRREEEEEVAETFLGILMRGTGGKYKYVTPRTRKER